MHANGVNGLNFKTSTFKPINDKAKRRTSIRTGENILVHEQAPDQILVLPRLAEPGNLQEENTVVVQHVADLGEEGGQVAHADVLGHLETGDLVVAAGHDGGVTVVAADDAALGFLDAGLEEGVVAPFGLVAAESDAGDVAAVVHAGIFGESAPAAA